MQLKLDIVTPERKVFSEMVDMVTLPASDGQIGVLPQHAPLITTLETGDIQLFSGNTVTKTLTISGGFAEITESGCVVLAESVAA